MRKRRYEILLPLKHNDGTPVPDEKFYEAREDLIAQFGVISLQPSFVQGVWLHKGVRYEDELRRIVVDVEESEENHQFFVQYKALLVERFQQLEIYIVSYLVDVV